MGKEPLVLTLGDWSLQIEIKDHWVQVSMVDGSAPRTHYMRLDAEQAQAMKHYLLHELPAHPADPR